MPAKWASFLTPSAANWETSLFPAQFTNDKIAALLTQRNPLLVGHDPGGFSSVCKAQVDNWHIQDLGGKMLLLTPARNRNLNISHRPFPHTLPGFEGKRCITSRFKNNTQTQNIIFTRVIMVN